MFPSKVMVLKLSEELQYLQFCAHLNQKPKSVKTIYIYASESSYYSLTDYDHMVYRGLSHRSWDINNSNIKKMQTQQKFNKVLQFQTPIFPKH